MKKEEIELIEQNLNKIKQLSDKQTYNLSSELNSYINKIRPIVDHEKARLDSEKIKCDAPMIRIEKIYKANIDNVEHEIEDLMNLNLQQLIYDEFKIIDYDIITTFTNSGCWYFLKIKYTK